MGQTASDHCINIQRSKHQQVWLDDESRFFVSEGLAHYKRSVESALSTYRFQSREVMQILACTE
jgi:hypothetical protein